MSPAILEYLSELANRKFWGFISVKYENGVIVHLRQEENLKPSELPGKNRGNAYAGTSR